MQHVSDSRNSGRLEPLELAGTLCARLCHDLASSVGGLTGSLEIAAAEHDPEALSLALACARELTARLRLLRAAWAMDGGCADLTSLVAGLPGAEKLRVDASALSPAVDAELQRLALNLLLVAAVALPRGGTIRLSGGEQSLAVEIAGIREVWPAALGACMEDARALREAATTPRDVAVAMACLQAAAIGLTLSVSGRVLRAA